MRKMEFCCTVFVFCCTIFAGGRAQAPRPPPRRPELEGVLQDTSTDLVTADDARGVMEEVLWEMMVFVVFDAQAVPEIWQY